MARQKSDLLSKLGIVFNITKALVDAALRARVEDDETLLRQIEDPTVADGIIKDLMARAGVTKPTPDTSGLRVLKVMVRGSDSRWTKIRKADYVYCNDTARTGDFPVHPTDREVTVAIFPPNYFDHNPTNEELRAEIARRNLSNPDLAVTETTLDELKAELAEKPTVGVCGVVQSDAYGYSIVGCVYENADGRSLDLDDLQYYWDRHYQFVAVVSE